MSDFKLDFQDTETAFADRSNAELKEKYRLFKLLGSPMLTAIGTRSATLALSLGLPVEGLIKRTIYEQFCGGETIEECEPTVERLAAANIGSILDYSVEGKTTEHDFDLTKDEIIRTIDRAAYDPRIPFAVFKMTGIAPTGTLERLSARKKLDAKSQVKCEAITSRVNEICAKAFESNVRLFIDAEDSWFQDAIDRIAVEMMEKYNREQPIIFNTFQMYRHDRLDYLRESRRAASAGGYFLGAKLVRGAYMEKERDRAEEENYPSPIYPDKRSTDDAYNAAVEYCLGHLDSVSFVAGTHNEESTQMLAQKMNARGLPNDHPHIAFSQLYGMSDNLSYVLGSHGYNVSKYVPYGPVKDAVPYLTRRAQENTSVAGQVGRELELINRELRRRKGLET